MDKEIILTLQIYYILQVYIIGMWMESYIL